SDLLLVEYATEWVLHPHACAVLAYRTARDYAERYDGRHPSGLVPKSATLVKDIVAFWADFYQVSATPAPAPKKRKTMRPADQSEPASAPEKRPRRATFTPRQGQFLAFIHSYQKL